MESTDNRMTRLARNEITFREHIPAEAVVREIDAVTHEDVKALAAEIFNPASIGLAAIGPITEKDLTLDILRG
jgi:predicted Zn-dependent peptidase